MAKTFFCSYLEVTVDLTDERENHIIDRHPGTLPDYQEQLAETLADPDLIRSSDHDEKALLFSKWFSTIRTGRFLIVVVVSQSAPSRHWIVTTYTARKITGGIMVWKKI